MWVQLNFIMPLNMLHFMGLSTNLSLHIVYTQFHALHIYHSRGSLMQKSFPHLAWVRIRENKRNLYYFVSLSHLGLSGTKKAMLASSKYVSGCKSKIWLSPAAFHRSLGVYSWRTVRDEKLSRPFISRLPHLPRRRLLFCDFPFPPPHAAPFYFATSSSTTSPPPHG